MPDWNKEVEETINEISSRKGNGDWSDALKQIRIAELEDVLEACADYLEDYSDVVDGDYGEPAPNRAMNLLSRVKAALGEES